MNKQNLTAAGVVVAIILSLISIGRPGVPGQNGRNGTDGRDGQSLGAVSGPDRYFPRESSNGVPSQYWSSPLKASTSTDITNITLASYRVVASTTLETFTCSGTNVGYANVFEIGIGATPFATTTRLANKTVAASSSFEVVASTTSNSVLTPGTYINFNVASGTPSSVFNASGKCYFVGREV